MEDLEKQLQSALKREEPPAWFEARVLAAAARQPEQRRSRWQWTQNWLPWNKPHGGLRWATAVAAAGLVVSGVMWQHERTVEEYRDRAAGEAAKARLTLALKVTRTKLHRIEQKLMELNRAD